MKHKLPFIPAALYERCLLSSLVNAAASIRIPTYSYAESWEGMNYSFQYGSSTGTISFDLQHANSVCAIMQNDGSRACLYPKFNAEDFFDEAPATAKALAKKGPLQYLLYEFLVSDDAPKPSGFLDRIFKRETQMKSITVPVATTVFWCEGNEIFSCDTIKDFNDNGGGFISTLALSTDVKLKEFFTESYELIPEELELAYQLYQMKMNGNMTIHLDSISLMKQAGVKPISNKTLYGKQEFIISLKDIGFEVVE